MSIKTSLLLATSSIALLLCGPAFTQKDTTDAGFVDQALLPAKVISAKHEYNENNMRGALTLYREVLETDPTNTTALFGTARCHYNLKKYNLALEYYDKAIAIDSKTSDDLELFHGEILHRLSMLDEAIVHYTNFRDGQIKSSEDFRYAEDLIGQCRFAKEMMNNEVKVVIENLGEEINSRFDEYAPSVTADGKTLVFTSRRSDTKGGELNEKGDYKFFEDIYISTWDEEAKSWSRSEGISGQVNTETHDAVLSISPDGSRIFVYKNNTITTGEIFQSSLNRADGTWSAPEKMPRPINTSFYEGSISMTADGNTVYFISERMDAIGMGDIYVSHKKGEGWSSPKNLSKIVNTELDEKFVFIHPNGKTLYFSSNGHQTIGSYDIFKTELVNGQWSIPVNLGYPINTVNEESTFCLSKDNKTLYLAAEYDNSLGERDIYKVDVSSYELISEGYEGGSFGQVLVIVTDAEGKPLKGASVVITGAETDKEITTLKSDKTGRAKANLPLHMHYIVKVKHGKQEQSQEIQLKKNPNGETIQRVEISFK
jgi:Tol biopolymer transport system component